MNENRSFIAVQTKDDNMMHYPPEDILKRLRTNEISGPECCEKLSAQMDRIIKESCAEIFTHDDPVCILAVGGYGRGELCPYSDIDLLILVPDKLEQKLQDKIEAFFYCFWDNNIKLGHAVRTLRECLSSGREDQQILTSMLDARYLWGESAQYEVMLNTLKEEWSSGFQENYINEKLAERDKRHSRMGDTRYVLEPNIKDGKGGLRDFQTLFWITHVLYEATTPDDLQKLDILTKRETTRVQKAYEFLLTIRCHLHDIAGRAEERLHFDIQPELAQRLGYKGRRGGKAVERFMKHYFRITRDIGDLTRIVCANIETTLYKKEERIALPSGFQLNNGRIDFGKEQNLKNDPVLLLSLFRESQKEDLFLHPAAIRKVARYLSLITSDMRRNSEANRIFLDILTDPKNSGTILRRLNETGILERFIPEFRHAVALMQFDRYHMFTVDEHTLRAISIAHDLHQGVLKEQAPLASALIQDLKNHRVLIVALLLHDLCKGMGGDHSELGAEMALQICPRLGLNDQETRLCSWLVFDHLFLSHCAFRRDIKDPKTIDDVLMRVYDLERLNLLSVFTSIDIMAVGPGTYTIWKDALLQELYYSAAQIFESQSAPQTRTDKAPIQNIPQELPSIRFTGDPDKNASVVEIFTHDEDGLFAKLAGSLAAAGANILEARIHTHDDQQIAHDSFSIQSTAGAMLAESRYHKVKTLILDALNNDIDLDQKIAKLPKPRKKRDMVFDIPTVVKIDNKASASDTRLEIKTRDRPGLLYTISHILQSFRISIKSAKINTHGLKAIDVFYIQNKNGQKIDERQDMHSLKAAILKNLEKNA